MAEDNGFAMGYALGQDSNGGGGGNGNGMFGGGGDWIWIIVVFALLFGWNGNNGNGNGGGNSVGYILPGLSGYGGQADVQRGFDNQAVISKLDGITQGLCDGFYAMNNGMMQGFHGVDNALCGLGTQVMGGFNATQMAMMQNQNALQTQIANCCCENRESIANVRYDTATQACDTRNTIQNATRDIIEGQNAGTRAILDFLTNDKIATLQAENQSLKFAASQAAQNTFITANQEAQTAELIRRLGRDCPVPAFVVPNPNCCYPNGYGGYGSGCGCGC